MAGRRPGQTQTRDDILAAARNQFGQHGYNGATIRGIATEAGVNPALVHHFFRSKEQVFVAALNLPMTPSTIADAILRGPREQIGERVIRLFLGLWSAPESGQTFLALVRSVSSNEHIASLMRQFLEHTVVGPVSAALDLPPLRITGAAAQGIGLAMARYVIKVEPLASATDDEVVELVAPVLQHYFTP
ncbi:TetR/AcrR family transcriptional regulator [Actinophytocola algeriensis]|uniref:AcrR family transcriptional regulator n=1 Tax=Actinophytocola algeriensis TaxID=1768010 RepID=A0A7W7QAW4_9PSEU|nr:TetR family transcriptional regulator [Actinophytocola algeriensis]MBB4910262.1 AcrR family transcriptional regulator [Actinophytocola algeriensis]MBE1480749.1 AcrR family transcriptional regulator [Actinophytocola algeriensis]